MTGYYVSSDIELIVIEFARRAVSEDRNAIDEERLIKVINKFSAVIPEHIKYYETFRNLERW